ncbi:potassium voltage-gated channel subfamily a member 4 [Plakobranchus ocellatus]|uniref:Potassium voltage-gated channel subfamily a member 4 n=1 Tax=Plakobranchus ocellatus TaxID=259542 RepID=A0AAV4DG58_9GAST|nr:potassium voltage-gated channel subfamily a member 4 [Plakobranchus ocellatus]
MLLTLSDFLEVKPEFEELLEEYTAANDTLHVVHYGTFHKAVDWLEGTEICLDIFFTFEFAARLFTCPDKKHFVRNKHNIIDIMILTTAWTRAIYDRIITWDADNFTDARSFAMVVLNCMLGLRVLRMLHLAKIFRTLKVMYLSILASMQELALLVVVMGAGVLLFGSALYIAEGFSTPDNEALQFESIPDAMWWAIITMTTVGYGDFYPVHAAGYIVGAICAVSGLLLVAMPIAIVASNFSVYYDNMSSRDQSLRRRSMLGKLIGIAMADRRGPEIQGTPGNSEKPENESGSGDTHNDSGGDDMVSNEENSSKESSIETRRDVKKTERTVGQQGAAKTVHTQDGRPKENGHVDTISENFVQKKRPHKSLGASEVKNHVSQSRKERHSGRPRSSSSSRSNKTNSSKTSKSKGHGLHHKVRSTDDNTHNRQESSRAEKGYVKNIDVSPRMIDYVGFRVDGVRKDRILDEEDGQDLATPRSTRSIGLNESKIYSSQKNSPRSIEAELSPVG